MLANWKSQIMNQRIEFIDLVKGVCILLVVGLHSGCIDIFPGDRHLEVPLFYVLSGLFFKDYGVDTWRKKINSLIVPFVAFYILGDLFYLIIYKLGVIAELKPYPCIDMFWNCMPCDLPIWFLISLMTCYMTFWGITRVAKTEFWRGCLVMVATSLGIGMWLMNWNPYFIGSALSAMPFFYMGYALKRTALLSPGKWDKFCILIAVALYAVAWVGMHVWWSRLSIYRNFFEGNVLLAYIISAFIILATIFLCKAIKWLPLISFAGCNSLVVLVIHMPIIPMVKRAQIMLLHNESCYLLWLLSSLVTLALVPLVKKLMPYSTCQKELFKKGRFSFWPAKLAEKESDESV